jgi:hypothetical protein
LQCAKCRLARRQAQALRASAALILRDVLALRRQGGGARRVSRGLKSLLRVRGQLADVSSPMMD